jgi:hypothetical protein
VPCRYKNPIGKEAAVVRVVRVQQGGLGVPEEAYLESFPEPDATPEPEAEYPLVLVTWHDAWFDFDQTGPEDCRPDYLVRTVGFLVSDGTRFVSVAQEVLPDGDGFRAVTHIPRSIIESITMLLEDPDVAPPHDAG